MQAARCGRGDVQKMLSEREQAANRDAPFNTLIMAALSYGDIIS